MSKVGTGTKRESSKSDQAIVKAKATRKEYGDNSSDEDENQPPKVKGMSRRPKIIVSPTRDEDDESDEDLINLRLNRYCESMSKLAPLLETAMAIPKRISLNLHGRLPTSKLKQLLNLYKRRRHPSQ